MQSLLENVHSGSHHLGDASLEKFKEKKNFLTESHAVGVEGPHQADSMASF